MHQDHKRGAGIFSREFLLVIASSSALSLLLQMATPILPLFLTEYGTPRPLLGLVMASFSAGAFLFRPLAGGLIDRLGRRNMLLAGAAGMTLVYLGYLAGILFDVQDYRIFPLVMFCHGVTMALVSTTQSTVVADVLPKDKLAQGLGYFTVSGALAMTLGPALGLTLYAQWSMTAIVALSLGLLGLILAVGYSLRYDESAARRGAGAKDAPSPVPAPKQARGVLERSALLPAVLMSLGTLGYSPISTYLALYAASLGIANIGGYFAVSCVGFVLSRLFVGQAQARLGTRRLLMLMLGSMAGVLLALSFVTELWQFYLCGVVASFAYGGLNPLTQQLAARRAPSERRGRAMATYFTVSDIGSVTGTVSWSALAALGGYPFIYRAASGIFLLNFTLAALLGGRFTQEQDAA